MSSEDKGMVSRRGLLAKSAVVTAMLASGAHGAGESRQKAGSATRRDRGRQIGLQLFSVRSECKRDLSGTMAAVAKMGYKGVEFAGYYGYAAKQLRKILDDNGLKCCGTHTGINTLVGDELAKTIEFNETIGNKYLVVAGLPGKYRESHQAWLYTARLFNEIAEKVKPHGIFVGYHNMGYQNNRIEFQVMDGELPWDTFYGNTRKEVIMQLDVGNAMRCGADPLPYLYKYPGRAITVHLQEYSKTNPNALVGQGDVNWKAFFALCQAVGSTEWYIVEYAGGGAPRLESVEKCLKNLRRLRLV
jgi:sugar phosphate isomerase/epimerase